MVSQMGFEGPLFGSESHPRQDGWETSIVKRARQHEVSPDSRM